MNGRPYAFALLVAVAAIPLSARSEDGMSITLQFMPHDNIKAPAVLPSTPITVLALKDVRSLPDRTLIGENRQRKVPKPIRGMFPLPDGGLSGEPVADFSTFVLRKYLPEWGARIDERGLRLSGEITNLFVVEENMYRTQMSVLFRLADPGGNLLWEGTASGEAHQWGRSLSYENYKEQISDAILRTMIYLLKDDGFQRAWRGSEDGAKKIVTASVLKAQVMKMMEAGITEDVIVGYVRSLKIEPGLTLEEIIEWKTAGLPDSAIAAAVGREPLRKREEGR